MGKKDTLKKRVLMKLQKDIWIINNREANERMKSGVKWQTFYKRILNKEPANNTIQNFKTEATGIEQKSADTAFSAIKEIIILIWYLGLPSRRSKQHDPPDTGHVPGLGHSPEIRLNNLTD